MDGLLKLIAKEVGEDNLYVYADDLLVYCRNERILKKVVETIKIWAKDMKVEINYGEGKTVIMPLVKKKSQ